MTRRVLQHQQLAMFMAPDEIIDTAWKGDSWMHRDEASPRHQWEGQRYDWEPSLREVKLEDIDDRGSDYEQHMQAGKPVMLHYDKNVYGDRPQLDDGHHRLAYHERRRTPYIPVTHTGR